MNSNSGRVVPPSLMKQFVHLTFLFNFNLNQMGLQRWLPFFLTQTYGSNWLILDATIVLVGEGEEMSITQVSDSGFKRSWRVKALWEGFQLSLTLTHKEHIMFSILYPRSVRENEIIIDLKPLKDIYFPVNLGTLGHIAILERHEIGYLDIYFDTCFLSFLILRWSFGVWSFEFWIIPFTFLDTLDLGVWILDFWIGFFVSAFWDLDFSLCRS